MTYLIHKKDETGCGYNFTANDNHPLIVENKVIIEEAIKSGKCLVKVEGAVIEIELQDNA